MAKIKYEISEGVAGKKMLIGESNTGRACLAEGTFEEMAARVESLQKQFENSGADFSEKVNPDWRKLQKQLENIPMAQAKVSFTVFAPDETLNEQYKKAREDYEKAQK